MYKAIVRARVRRGIQRLNEGNAEFVLRLAVPDIELAFPGDNSWAAMYWPVKKSRERHVTHRGVAEVRRSRNGSSPPGSSTKSMRYSSTARPGIRVLPCVPSTGW
jgi:hypothetical protein